LSKSLFIDYNVTWNREARAQEAATALKLAGHNPAQGFLLDLGCGTGSTTKWFSNNLGVYSVGIEVIGTFADRAKHSNPRLNYVFASGANLPFQEKVFHTVVLNDVLEHISYRNAPEVFKQISDVMDEEGMLYISVASKFEVREPHSNQLFLSWLPRWIYAPIVRKKFHDDVYPYTTARFRKLTQTSGFSFENLTYLYVIKKMQNLNYIGNTMLRPIVRVLNRIGLTRSPGFLRFLEPFGVLVFVCKKQSKGIKS
jgi:cyclopropane fatty-acyl-phospholipid synthase-like methyltransferase